MPPNDEHPVSALLQLYDEALGRDRRRAAFYDSGAAANCVDDQGTRFFISVPADKYRN